MHDFQQDVNRLLRWCQLNRLSINVKKTKFVFHPHSANVENKFNNEIRILNTPVDYVNSYLYLGVNIDNLLTFKKYFSNVLKKISYKLSLLRRIRYMVTLKASLDITKTMFCSNIVDYGNIFLSSCIENDINGIQTLQNRALRCCHTVQNYRDEHVVDLHKGLVINYGEGGLQNGRGGHVKFYPYEKGGGGGTEKVLAMLKGGGAQQVLG